MSGIGMSSNREVGVDEDVPVLAGVHHVKLPVSDLARSLT